jgi:DnaJ-domain-containing protein 1
LTVLSGLPEAETLRLIYALALSGLIQRDVWTHAFRTDSQAPVESTSPSVAQPIPDAPQSTESDAESLQRFLDRVEAASTHYEVLDVASDADPPAIKKSYYEFARRYHPDRFRKDSDAALNSRIETTFARVTQAYETLRQAGTRATYDSKLENQRRLKSIAESAPKSTSTTTPPPLASAPEDLPTARGSNSFLTDAAQAEQHFKEGFAAKQMGQINTAIGLLSSAARLAPNDARYRAYYGNALATQPSTRRLAEAELSAAVKLDPGNVDYRVMLAELYRDLGFAVRARSEVEKLLKLSPNHQKARELLRSL